MALKIEERHKRRSGENIRGGRVDDGSRGRGKFKGRSTPGRNQEETNKLGLDGDSNTRGAFRGKGSSNRGRFGGRGPSVFIGKCFTCNQLDHQSFRCPQKVGENSRQGGERRV